MSTYNDIRIPRINENVRNISNELFKFGGAHNYESESKRFVRNVAQEEKVYQQNLKNKKNIHDEICRNYVKELEQQRWKAYGRTLEKDTAIIEQRKATHPAGKSGVGYDILTNNYLGTAEGQKLRLQETANLNYYDRNSTDIYLKNNTYNPIQGYEIAPNFHSRKL